MNKNNYLALLFLSVFSVTMQAQETKPSAIRYTNKNNFDINYPITKDKILTKVELWVTEDGGDTWLLANEDKDLNPPVTFTANKDGLYGFFVLIESENENEKKSAPTKGSKPQWLYVLDRKKPEINLDSQKNLVFKAGGEVPLKWALSDAHLGDLPISIAISVDKNKTWTTLQVDVKDAPTSIKAPSEDKTEFQIKITAKDQAGNEAEAISENLTIDGLMPIAKVIGPSTNFKSKFEVIIQTHDEGKAGIKGINLWFSLDNGAEWKLFAKDLNPQTPIIFTPPLSSRVGLYASASDTAGNEGFQPVAGTPPQHTVLTDNQKPVIEILEPVNFSSIAGGKKLEIKWEAKDENIKNFPVDIYYSIDEGNQWISITKNEKAKDSFFWLTPKVDSKKCCLKLIAIDEAGNFGEAILPFFFEIDSTPPIATAMYLQNKDIPSEHLANTSETAIETKKLDYVTSEFLNVENLKEDKQFELAMEKLQKLEEKYPENSRIYYEKALILSSYLVQDNSLSMNQAINLLEKAISLNNNYEAAYILRGSIYYKKYSVEKDEKQKIHYLLLAEHEYLNAIKILGDTYEEYSNLGIIYFRLNRNEDAKKYLLKATLLKKNPGICYWYLARISENEENFEKAENYWRKAAGAYGVNTIYGEKAVLNVESAKSKKIGQQILE
jgi:Flp pilus assembly protein TadD